MNTRKTRKTLTTEDYEKIINSRLIFGKTVAKTAEETDFSEDVITKVFLAFQAVQRRDWVRASELIDKRKCSLNLMEWCCQRLDTEMPNELRAAYDECVEKRRQANLQKLEKEKAAEKTEEKPATTNDAIYFCRLLQEVERQNELLLQLMDVVIPKWIGDLKENNNANADMLNKTLQAMDAKAECIKVNTRKRGL